MDKRPLSGLLLVVGLLGALGLSAAVPNTFVDGAGNLRVGDTESFSVWADFGFRFTGKETQGTFHFVVGQMSSERQDGSNVELDSSMVGISVPIDVPWVAKGFRVRPEIFVYDNDNNGNDFITTKNGTEVLGGIQLQYTF